MSEGRDEGKLDGRGHFRHRCKWEDDIKTDLMAKVVDCIHITQDSVQWRAVVNTAMNIRAQ